MPRVTTTTQLPPLTGEEPDDAQVRRANASGRTPVVFVHGLWLLPRSWAPWAARFEDAGYVAVLPSWPGEARTVTAARRDADALAGATVGKIATHLEGVLDGLDATPALVGHSFGGLLVQLLAGRRGAAATVAIDPAPFRGVLPLPVSSLRSAFPVLGNPLNRGRTVSLTFEQFRYGWAAHLDEAEARALYDEHHVPAPGAPLFQAAVANLNPLSELKPHPRAEHRGPLLLVSGEQDKTVPWALTNAAYKRQRHNAAPTEVVEVPGRGHALTIDAGWREVADTALAFVQRFAPVTPA